MWQFLIGRMIEKNSIRINSSHCLHVRFKNYSCQSCKNICPAKAINIENNQITIDESRCNQCGLCAHICPTETFFIEQERLSAYEEKIHDKEQVCITCAKQSNNEQDISLPCLSLLTPEMLMIAVIKRIPVQIFYQNKICDSCDLSFDQQYLIKWVNKWNSLFTDNDKAIIINDSNLKKSKLKGISRREFFTSGKSKVKKQVGSFIYDSFKKDTVKDKIQLSDKRQYLKQFIKLDRYYGTIIDREIAKQLKLININVSEECTVCGRCSVICPTGALITKKEENNKVLYFEPIKCIDCDVCIKQCGYLSKSHLSDITFKEVNKARQLASVQLDSCPKCGKDKNVQDDFCEECFIKINKQRELTEFWF